MNAIENHPLLKAERISPTDTHCFFGYFDKYPWNRSQDRLLAHQTPSMGRQPSPGEKATIGMFRLAEGNEFIPLAETSAWNWQQGAMLQWLHDDPGKIIYNDREDDRFVARILDVGTGEKQTVCRPIYCLSPDGRHALSVNFALLDKERPGYGYPGVGNPWEGIDHPDDDGIWLIDLKKNSAELLISYDQIVKEFHLPSMDNVSNWFNHLLFSPDGKRFAFFHRWRTDRMYKGAAAPAHTTHMFTAGIDGDSLCPLNLDDMSSHYTWVDNTRIIKIGRAHV